MGFLIEAVAIYSAYIYAACGLVALYHIYKVWQVRSERRQAVFSLEREKAVRELRGIFSIAMLLLVITGLTYFVSTTLAQAVEPIVAESREPQPPLPIIPTPTNTPLPVTPTTSPAVLPTPTIAITSTLETPEAAATRATSTPESQPTPVPQPIVAAPACPDGRSAITSPGNGQVVSGVIGIVGTATHEGFQYYKVEFAPGAGAEGGFVYLGGGNSPVENGILATVDTAALGPGVWTLRLVVVDQTGNFPAPCAVTITVAG